MSLSLCETFNYIFSENMKQLKDTVKNPKDRMIKCFTESLIILPDNFHEKVIVTYGNCNAKLLYDYFKYIHDSTDKLINYNITITLENEKIFYNIENPEKPEKPILDEDDKSIETAYLYGYHKGEILDKAIILREPVNQSDTHPTPRSPIRPSSLPSSYSANHSTSNRPRSTIHAFGGSKKGSTKSKKTGKKSSKNAGKKSSKKAGKKSSKKKVCGKKN